MLSTAADDAPAARIVLTPQAGAMQVSAQVPHLQDAVFALGIPETIGCREALLVNFPEARIDWEGPDSAGAVSCSWGPGGRISYSLRLTPAEDYVDIEMTVRNHTEFLWHDVFAFNCVNPIKAPAFQDWKLLRTYMQSQGQPRCMAETKRVQGNMPTVQFYLPEHVSGGTESVFVRGFGATSPDRTDGSWIVTVSEPAGTYMAATAWESAFLFDNLDRCCLHAAPSFGDIGPGEASTTVSRIYLATGDLTEFLERQAADRARWPICRSGLDRSGVRCGHMGGWKRWFRTNWSRSWPSAPSPMCRWGRSSITVFIYRSASMASKPMPCVNGSPQRTGAPCYRRSSTAPVADMWATNGR